MRFVSERVLLVAFVGSLCGCQASAPRPAPEQGPDCEASRARLVKLLQRLPEQAMSLETHVALPTSTLGGGLGPGPILELSDTWVALDGVPIEGETHEQTIEQLNARLRALPPEESQAGVLYIAAAADTDIRTLQAYLRALPKSLAPKVLFGAPSLARDASLGSHDLAARVFAERDPKKRLALAKEGYAAYSSCPAVDRAVGAVDGVSGEARWPLLRKGMLDALGSCRCEQLDSENLGSLLVAEHRSSGAAIGSLLVDFLADERCSAAMPLRSVQQVLGDVEKFEEDFSGQWKGEALQFEEIVTSDRLLVYLCNALPGETLASLERARRTLYFKTASGCQGWQFAPQSPGAPMGTWQRVGAMPGAMHYRQYAEEIRLFGPLTGPDSQPTDDSAWQCTQDFKMDTVDADSVGLEHGGRWFFDEQACRKAPAADAFPPGCVVDTLINAR